MPLDEITYAGEIPSFSLLNTYFDRKQFLGVVFRFLCRITQLLSLKQKINESEMREKKKITIND